MDFKPKVNISCLASLVQNCGIIFFFREKEKEKTMGSYAYRNSERECNET